LQYNYTVSLRVELPITKRDSPINLSDIESDKLKIAEWFRENYTRRGGDFMVWFAENYSKRDAKFLEWFASNYPVKEDYKIPSVVVLGIMPTGERDDK